MARMETSATAKKPEDQTAANRAGWQSLIQLRYDMDRMFDVDVEKIDAKFAKGVLAVTIPKKGEAAVKTKRIAIAAE